MPSATPPAVAAEDAIDLDDVAKEEARIATEDQYHQRLVTILKKAPRHSA
jgi:hypothetical protein